MRYLLILLITVAFAGCVTLDKAKAKLEKNPEEAAKWAQKMFPTVLPEPTFDSTAYKASIAEWFDKYNSISKSQDSLLEESAVLKYRIDSLAQSDTGQCAEYITYIIDLETMVDITKENLRKAIKDCQTNVKPIIKEIPVRDAREEAILKERIKQGDQLLSEANSRASKFEGMYIESNKTTEKLKGRLTTIYTALSLLLVILIVIGIFKFRGSLIDAVTKIVRFGK
jgi:hypothetical protein